MLTRKNSFFTLTNSSTLNDIRVADLLNWRACDASISDKDTIVTFRTSDIPDVSTELPQYVQLSDSKEIIRGPPILKNTLLDSSTIVEDNKVITAVSSLDNGVQCNLTLYHQNKCMHTFNLGLPKTPYMMLPSGVNLSKGNTSYVAYSYASADVVTAPYPFRQQLGIVEIKDLTIKHCVEITMSEWNKFAVVAPHCPMLLKQFGNKYLLIVGASKWDPENLNKDPQLLVYVYDSILRTLVLSDTVVMESPPTAFCIVGPSLIVGCKGGDNLQIYDISDDELPKIVKKRSMSIDGSVLSIVSISDSTLGVVVTPYNRQYEKTEPIPYSRPPSTLLLLNLKDKLTIVDMCIVSPCCEALDVNKVNKNEITVLIAGSTTYAQGDISLFTIIN